MTRIKLVFGSYTNGKPTFKSITQQPGTNQMQFIREATKLAEAHLPRPQLLEVTKPKPNEV